MRHKSKILSRYVLLAAATSSLLTTQNGNSQIKATALSADNPQVKNPSELGQLAPPIQMSDVLILDDLKRLRLNHRHNLNLSNFLAGRESVQRIINSDLRSLESLTLGTVSQILDISPDQLGKTHEEREAVISIIRRFSIQVKNLSQSGRVTCCCDPDR